MAQTTKPYFPFTPEREPLLSPLVIGTLEENISKMGAQGPRDRTGGQTPVRVEEQYELDERRALSFTNTAPSYYDLITSEPKQVLLIADGADVYFDLNRQISSDSPKIFNGGSFTATARNTTRIWFQGVSTSGTLRLVVFKR